MHWACPPLLRVQNDLHQDLLRLGLRCLPANVPKPRILAFVAAEWTGLRLLELLMSGFQHDVSEQLRDLMKRALAGSATFEELRRAYAALEQVANETAMGDELVGTVRTIAADLLTVAQVLQEPTSTCDPLFERVVEVGFRDVQDHLLQVGAYARYCLERRHASRIGARLEAALRQARAVFDPAALAPFEELLGRVKNAQD